jgi:hypothetical protein
VPGGVHGKLLHSTVMNSEAGSRTQFPISSSSLNSLSSALTFATTRSRAPRFQSWDVVP